MKLYVYDHCPFCVRARMPFGLKNIPFELAFMANDDEETPIRMIGKKMAPILEDDDGHMAESLDIVHKVDSLSGERLFAGTPRKEITDWLKTWGSTVNALVIPRTPDPVFPEFRTASARAYFTEKKEATFGAFDGLLAETETHKAEILKGLGALSSFLPDAEASTIDDIMLFPTLRSLSIVPDLAVPEPVEAYRTRMAERCGVPLVSELRKAA
ncbi:glutaredoxin 2 [Martelella radicis]|uniref:Glutaredoxin 2 n=1 Tax=Martelella radicis TaxID=1397476 RepID=A0A7W6KHR2_9HYPH|nr:glutaredoxin 2 [Martelella radicis]MBB4121348.1 glutaredoxin 2 [Martelella radicis]